MITKQVDSADVRIRTGSRLHFGLVDTHEPFGGVGVMIERPVTEVTVEAAARFETDVPARVLPIVRRVLAMSGVNTMPGCRVRILTRPPSHCGLGSGTQLSLAVTEALCRMLDQKVAPKTMAVGLAGRGKRSAVGVHGYFGGGMIFESAPEEPTPADPASLEIGATTPHINPVVTRVELPTAWRVAVFSPPGVAPVSGQTESTKFSRLQPPTVPETAAIKRLATERLMPAAESGDFTEFSDALYDYNHASGLLFASVQGGAYHGPATTGLVAGLRESGIRGVGQSSWGPGVFAWFATPETADQAVAELKSRGFPAPLFVTAARRGGRQITGPVGVLRVRDSNDEALPSSGGSD